MPGRSTREEMVDERLVLDPVDLTLHPPPTDFACPLAADLHTPSVVVLHGDDGVPDERRGLGENGGPDGGPWVGFRRGCFFVLSSVRSRHSFFFGCWLAVTTDGVRVQLDRYGR